MEPSPEHSAIWVTAFEYLIPIIGTVLSAVATLAIKKMYSKLGVDLDDAQQESIAKAVRTAVWASEEWCAKQAKVKSRPQGRDKLAYALQLLRTVKPDVSENVLVTMIESECARTKGLGADKEMSA